MSIIHKLEAALSNLTRRIEAGEESPDACRASASSFNVNYEHLQEAYDNAEQQERLYHLVLVSNPSFYATVTPMSHKRCMTLKSKFSMPNNWTVQEVTQ